MLSSWLHASSTLTGYLPAMRSALVSGILAAAAGAVLGVVGVTVGPFTEGQPTGAHDGGDVIFRKPDGLPTPLATPGTIAEVSSDGFTASLKGIETLDGATTIFFTLQGPEGGKWDIVGDVRGRNANGSIAFPSVTGPTGDMVLTSGSTQVSQMASVFDSDEIEPGATLEFGPFVVEEAGPVEASATGAALGAGVNVDIAGDAFLVTLQRGTLADGVTETSVITLTNTAEDGSVQLNYPGHELAVEINGEPIEAFKGGSGFTKQEGYHINVGQADLVLVATIADTDLVELSAESFTRLVKGVWAIPLE